MRVTRCELVMPLASSRIRIKRQHGATEEVISFAKSAVQTRRWIACGPIERIQIRIVAAGKPRCRAAMLPTVTAPTLMSELARPGHGVEAPYPLARFRVIGIKKAANAELATSYADDHFVFHCQRRCGNRVSLHGVGNLRLPELASGARVQRYERRIQSAHKDAVSKHRNAAAKRVG